MPERFVLHELACDAARFARIGTALLAPGGDAKIVVARLTGDAILLGRHQRATSLHKTSIPLDRRLGGGRTVRVGDGVAGIYVRLPSSTIAPDKLINRLVRVVLAATGARYFGRDWISVEGRQVGVVAHEAAPSGVVLLEAIVGLSRTLEIPDALVAYPTHGDPRARGPEWGTLGEAGLRLEQLGETAPASDEPPLGDAPDPAVDEDETGWRWSGRAEVPIGFIESLVRVERDGDRDRDRIAEARLRGDFLAPAAQVRALERSAVGIDGRDAQALAAAFSRALDETSRWGAILGVDDPAILASAIHAAAVST